MSTLVYPSYCDTQESLGKAFAALNDIEGSLPTRITGKPEILYTRNNQPYIGVIVDPQIVYSWIIHLIENANLHSSDFLKFLESQSWCNNAEKILNMLIYSQIRDAKVGINGLIPEFHITLVSPPLLAAIRASWYREDEIIRMFSNAISFSILGIWFAEGTMVVEGSDLVSNDEYPGGSVYIAVEAEWYKRDRTGTIFSFGNYWECKQWLHITIGFKSLDIGSWQVFGDIFFNGKGQVVKDHPSIVATPLAWKLETVARDERVVTHIQRDHGWGVLWTNKPAQLGFLESDMQDKIVRAINTGDPFGLIKSIWTVQKFKSQALIILTNEKIWYKSLLTVEEIESIFWISGYNIKKVLSDSYLQRKKLATQRFCEPDKLWNALLQLNNRHFHSKFRFMERTGFLALAVLLDFKDMAIVPKLSSVIVPGKEIHTQRDGGRYIWEFPTMYPAVSINPRFPHDRTIKHCWNVQEALDFWVPEDPKKTPVFLLY